MIKFDRQLLPLLPGALAFLLLAALLAVRASGSTEQLAAVPLAMPPATPSPVPAATPAPLIEAAQEEPLAATEVAVVTLATGLRAPRFVAVAPDGSRFVIHEDGALTAHKDGVTAHLGQTPGNGVVRGFAVDTAHPDGISVYTLTDEDGGAALHWLVVDGGTPGQAELLAELSEPIDWGGNALAFDAEGVLRLAPGEASAFAGSLDVSELAARLAAATGSTFTGISLSDYGCLPPDRSAEPWIAQRAPASPRGGGPTNGGALPVALDGAAAIVHYAHFAIPEWNGSLFVLTDEGRLIRAPWHEDACYDFGAAELLYGELGTIRDVVAGPDGGLYLLTANQLSGRHPDDDRLLHITPMDGLDLRYPDLRTHAPSSLNFDFAWVDSQRQPVLRFTNTVVNVGDGPLEIYAHDPAAGVVVQRIYTADGSYIERDAGRIIYHWSHAHFHFDHFNRFELWERETYEQMQAGDPDAAPVWVDDKVSMCLMDLVRVWDSPRTPTFGVYGDDCTGGAQGISVGWADIYYFDIPEQWVTVGSELHDGDYVLRSITDSENLFHESPGGTDPDFESFDSNSGRTWFTVAGGWITVTETESGADDLPDR
jgi:hypothetical protein